MPKKPIDPTAVPTDPELAKCLVRMGSIYRDDPEKAVRAQSFIKPLHEYVGSALDARLSKWARKRGIRVVYEAKVLGSHKPKDVDVAVMDPDNGPLMLVGIRSQMSSVSKNALNYYEGIIGECISLQDRFPMAVHGYLYLMPLKPIKTGKESESIDHARFARMYSAITGREGIDYSRIRGVYDQMAYMIVDFESDMPAVRDDLLDAVDLAARLSVSNFTERLIDTFAQRMLFWDVFEATPDQLLIK